MAREIIIRRPLKTGDLCRPIVMRGKKKRGRIDPAIAQFFLEAQSAYRAWPPSKIKHRNGRPSRLERGRAAFFQ